MSSNSREIASLRGSITELKTLSESLYALTLLCERNLNSLEQQLQQQQAAPETSRSIPTQPASQVSRVRTRIEPQEVAAALQVKRSTRTSSTDSETDNHEELEEASRAKFARATDSRAHHHVPPVPKTSADMLSHVSVNNHGLDSISNRSSGLRIARHSRTDPEDESWVSGVHHSISSNKPSRV